MDQIRQQVARARRRLWLELFLHRLVRVWFVTLLMAAAAIAVPKIWAIENLPAQWAALWLGGALVGGLAITLGWMWFRSRSELDAAIEIDRRFNLRERVASSLSLSPTVADTPAGQALLHDASHAISRLQIDERFRIRLDRSAWLPVGPALLALLLVAVFENQLVPATANAASGALTKQERENTAKLARKPLAELKKEAAKKDLKDAEFQKLLQEMEKQVEKMAAKKDLDRKQGLVDLNDLAKKLNERREKLGGEKELQKQLATMKEMNKGPADKMVQAMQKGDWDKAQQELDKLAQQVKDGKLDEAGQKELEQQMSQLKEQLQQAAAARQQAMDQLQQQIEQQKQAGNLAEAGDLQQKLDQLQKQQSQSKALEKLAQQMGQCQSCMKQGDQQGAAQALEQMQQQLGQMQQEMSEGEMLDQAMQQLEMAKSSLGCKECQGAGCEACQGGKSLVNKPGQKQSGGKGYGTGTSAGKRPDDPKNAAFRDSQVKQTPGKGPAVITGEAEGPNMRGNVREQIKEEMAAKGSEPADPLVIETLPKSHRENAQDYFDRLREGDQ
jgi:hypothetical protein